MRCFLAMAFEESSKIFGIRVEFVYSFEVVIAANDFVGDAERGEIFGCDCVALSGAGEEFVGVVGIVVAIFGFAEVAQRDEGDAVFADFRFGFFEDWEEVLSTSFVVFHFAWVDVKVADDSDHEGVGIIGRVCC